MDLMRFPTATRHDPAIDSWLAAQSPEFEPLARKWFERLRRCGPDIRELMHDNCPTACVGDIALGYVNVFSRHLNVGFFLGSQLDDPAELLQGSGKRMRHVKLRIDSPVDEGALQRLIEDACADIRCRGTVRD